MNHASIETSKRLQRLLFHLSDGAEHTTLDCIVNTGLCAINSAVAEIRENGFKIRCRCISRGVFAYRLVMP